MHYARVELQLPCHSVGARTSVRPRLSAGGFQPVLRQFVAQSALAHSQALGGCLAHAVHRRQRLQDMRALQRLEVARIGLLRLAAAPRPTATRLTTTPWGGG